MRIHRVRGRSLEEALQRARIQHGEAALVLSQESAENGDVWLAVSERRQAKSVVFPSVSADAQRREPSVRKAGEPSKREGANAAQQERGSIASRNEREALASPRGPGVMDAPLERGASDVRARLERAQLSNEWIERVLSAVRSSNALGAFAIDAAASELSRGLRIAPSPRGGGRMRALAFIGPTGVGKTTTLAKLAVRLVRAGRRVALVSTDTYRVGALEQLAAYGELLQAPVRLARDGDELAQVAAESSQVDALLIDTTGRSPNDSAALERLVRGLESTRLRAQLETYLVLAASASRESLYRASDSFAAARPTAAILTKLDETRAPGPAVETGSACGGGLLFFCDGQDVSAHLQRASADACADLVLRGRLA